MNRTKKYIKMILIVALIMVLVNTTSLITKAKLDISKDYNALIYESKHEITDYSDLSSSVSEVSEEIKEQSSLSTETDLGVTGEAYLDSLADRIGVDKESYLDENGLYFLMSAAGDTMPEGLSKAYPNVDFNQTKIPISDEVVTNQLILNEKLKRQSSEIKYKEISVDEDAELDFQAQIHSVQYFRSLDDLDTVFKESEAVQSDISFFEENPYSDIHGFVLLDVTFTNLSECKHGIYVNDLPIYTDFGSIGIYSIVIPEVNYMDFTYCGGTRGTGASFDRLYLNPGEASRLQILYADYSDFADHASLEDLYIDLTSLIWFGNDDGEGMYHANTDEKLALYKLIVDP